MADENTRNSLRINTAIRVQVRYPDVPEPVMELVTNLSRGGVFIASWNPRTVGTIVRFEFSLQAGLPSIVGEGEVVWILKRKTGSLKRQSGMGIRFLRLEPDSRAVLENSIRWNEERPRMVTPPPLPPPMARGPGTRNLGSRKLGPRPPEPPPGMAGVRPSDGGRYRDPRAVDALAAEWGIPSDAIRAALNRLRRAARDVDDPELRALLVAPPIPPAPTDREELLAHIDAQLRR